MGQTGIFGKHPAFGDFIGAGLSKPMQVGLEEWLGAVLPRVRDNLGGVWQAYYDIALPLRFWLGEGVCPRDVPGPVAGVLVFSHDKVGRRFPLIALREVGDMPPPTLVPDQRWYDALQARMLEHETPETASELAGMLDLDDTLLPAAFEGGETGFWAVHRAGQVEDLLGNVAATDHRRAASRRSYWWCAGDPSRTATFHVMEGWPDAAVMQWLIAGNPAEEDVPEPDLEPDPEAVPEPAADPFLDTAAVAASASAAAEAEEDTPEVAVAAPPSALYAEPEVPDGPESPFSRREMEEAAPEEAEQVETTDVTDNPRDTAKDRLAGEGE